MSYYRTKLNSEDFTNDALIKSYETAWLDFIKNNELNPDYIRQSRKLFNIKKNIEPKELNVKAIVLGLEFSYNIQNAVEKFQDKIRIILGNNEYYLVRPENLAIEVLVVKWHDESSVKKIHDNSVIQTIKKCIETSFEITLDGYQIHNDGCIIGRVFDRGVIRELRYRLKMENNAFPQKQSSWCHIPIGRILSNITIKQKKELEQLINNENLLTSVSEHVESIKYVSEEKWYMERYKVISEIYL